MNNKTKVKKFFWNKWTRVEWQVVAVHYGRYSKGCSWMETDLFNNPCNTMKIYCTREFFFTAIQCERKCDLLFFSNVDHFSSIRIIKNSRNTHEQIYRSNLTTSPVRQLFLPLFFTSNISYIFIVFFTIFTYKCKNQTSTSWKNITSKSIFLTS